MIRRSRPIRRGKRPRSRQADPLGDHRALVRYLDPIWSRLIRARSVRCVICRERPTSCAAHVFPKGKYPHIRFHLDNGVPLCGECHDRLDSDREWGTERRRQLLGDDDYEALRLLSLSPEKTDLQEVKAVLEEAARKKGFI